MKSDAGLDKAKIRRSFASAAQTYDSLAGLQRQAGLELLRRFPPKQRGDCVLDLGCGTGFLSRELRNYHVEERLIALDIALPMLQASRLNHPFIGAHYVCADAENLPFAEACIDFIYSNLALQWVHDIQTCLVEFHKLLSTEGRLVFSTFGPKTLIELKAAWASVDGFTHVNTFCSADEILQYMQTAGFRNIDIEYAVYRSDYPSVENLMHELKGIGAHNVNYKRNPKPTSRKQLQQMINNYQHQCKGPGISASYEILFVSAAK